METLEHILAEQEFMHGLNPEHVAILAGCATNVRFEAGQQLFGEGDEATQFFMLRQGHVVLETHVPGRGGVTVQTVGAGEILGWSWLVPPYEWRISARATELTRAIALDGTCLRKKCEADHDLGYEILKRFAHIINERLDTARVQLLDMYAKSTPARKGR